MGSYSTVHTKQDPQKAKNVTKVLLLAYMRGGSTFTGNILGFVPNVFYMYEPLRSTVGLNHLTEGKECSMKKPVCKSAPLEVKSALGLLEKSLECDFDDEIIRLVDIGSKGRSWRAYRACQTSKLNNCTSVLIKSCRESPIRVAKVLRLSVDLASQLLEKDTSLKIVHLVRDPRGILVSRSRMNIFNELWTNLSEVVHALCKEMLRDISNGCELERQYPSQYKTMRYEDLANAPVKMSRLLYDFLNYRYSQEDLSRIDSMQDTNLETENFFSTRRRNSSETASAWKQVDSPLLMEAETFSVCRRVNDLMGYTSSTTIAP